MTSFLLVKGKLLAACVSTGDGDKLATSSTNKDGMMSSVLKKKKLPAACGDTGLNSHAGLSDNTNTGPNNNTSNRSNNTNNCNDPGNCDDTGSCDNEKTEFEKINDDQLLISHSVYFDKGTLLIPLKSSFFYTVSFRNEIYRYIFSPPPELV